MKRVYYGTCKSGSEDSNKKVYVPDLDIIDDNFNFNEGDLLIVFFAQKNNVEEPSIIIYNQDPEQESSTTIDSGKYIKTLDVEAGLADAWDVGETVIFVYTQQDTSDSYYWELIDAAHATTDVYGSTKLFDLTNLNSLLEGNYMGDAENEALTPAALKKFYDLLNGEDLESDLGLQWTPDESISEYETQSLGKLSLSNSTEGIEITYPINALIQERIPIVPTHTGQLVNNGNGGGEGHETDASEPFITREVPNNLYFVNGSGLKTGNPNSSQSRITFDSDKTVIDAATGIQLQKPTSVNGTLTATGNISTSAYVYGGTLYEGKVPGTNNWWSLRDKYSAKLEVFSKNTGDFKVSTNNTIKHKTLSITRSGYVPIGVVGYNINFSGSKETVDARYANLWECFIINNSVQYDVYNLHSKEININITFYILYVRAI